MSNIFQKSKIHQNIVIRKESSLKTRAVFALISKYVVSDRVAVHVGYKKNWNIEFCPNEDNSDATVAVVDADMLQNDEEQNLEINSCLENMP